MGEKKSKETSEMTITAETVTELHDKIQKYAKKGWHLADKPMFKTGIKKNTVTALLTKDVNNIYINKLELES